MQYRTTLLLSPTKVHSVLSPDRRRRCRRRRRWAVRLIIMLRQRRNIEEMRYQVLRTLNAK